MLDLFYICVVYSLLALVLIFGDRFTGGDPVNLRTKIVLSIAIVFMWCFMWLTYHELPMSYAIKFPVPTAPLDAYCHK